MTVVLTDDDARALAALLARALVVEAREHAARPTGAAVNLLRRLAAPTPIAKPAGAPEWLSVAEVAGRMGCSTAYARRLAAAGRVVARKCGPVWQIRWPATVSPPQPRDRPARSMAA